MRIALLVLLAHLRLAAGDSLAAKNALSRLFFPNRAGGDCPTVLPATTTTTSTPPAISTTTTTPSTTRSTTTTTTKTTTTTTTATTTTATTTTTTTTPPSTSRSTTTTASSTTTTATTTSTPGTSTQTTTTPSTSASYIRGCYYTDWSHYRSGRANYVPEDYVSGLCTHIFFAFGWMGSNFTVQAYDPEDLPTSWAGPGMYARVNALKTNDTQLKTLLSIGGASFPVSLFQSMSSTTANRAIFINSAIAFVRQYGFDGIDLDWEFPQGPNDYTNFAQLITELYQAITQESQQSGRCRLLLTIAVTANAGLVPLGYNVPLLAQYLDWINLMSYDFHGTWDTVTGFNSPLIAPNNDSTQDQQFTVAYSAHFWVQSGMPASKVVIGIPMYGRGWTLTNPALTGVGAPGTPSIATQYLQTAGLAAYFEICEMLAAGATRIWDALHQVPYLVNGNQWFSYDDVQSITNKMAFIKANGYGGAFTWTLDMDDFNGLCTNGNGVLYPLHSVIAQSLGGVTIG